MKKLLVYLKEYRIASILGPMFKLTEALLELFVPLVIANIIDSGIANGDNAYIIKMCLLLILLGAVGLACSVTAQYFAAKASVGFTKKVRRALFVHIQSLSFSELDSLGNATLITRMTSDMNQIQTGVNLALRLLLRSPFVVFGAVIMAFTINSEISLIFVAAVILLSAVVFGIMLWCIPLYKKVQSRLDRVLSITRENLTGARVIRAFCREESETADFKDANGLLTDKQKYVGRISALMNPLTYVIINLAIIALIRRGAVEVNLGILTQGEVVALYNYMSQILVELIKLANLIINITKSVACANRVQAVLETGGKTEEVSYGFCSSEAKTDCAVEFDNVTLRYHRDSDEALSDISFKVKKGETVGIIGGTGSGKTSLAGLIPRFYDATKGKVEVDGTDVKNYAQKELRAKIGIVPQKAVLFAESIRDNMLRGNSHATDSEIYEALEAAQARDIADSKGGLDFKIEQGGKNLSGGQRQRLTIARALVRKPEILILDDSSSALDFATDKRLRAALKNLPYSPTVFIVSQRTSSIAHADKIVVLDDGKIAGIGTHGELLKSCAVYKEIHDSQFKREARANG